MSAELAKACVRDMEGLTPDQIAEFVRAISLGFDPQKIYDEAWEKILPWLWELPTVPECLVA